MAFGVHLGWLSKPRWARTSWKATSIPQRARTQARICSGLAFWSVAKKAVGGNLPRLSRTSIQRMGSGSKPDLYQRAQPVATSMTRLRPLYQAASWVCQTVVGLFKRLLRDG